MVTRRSLPIAVVAAALFAGAPPAVAGDADEPRAQALFLEGRAALEQGDPRAACEKLAASLALVQRASTHLNLAQCEERQGHLVVALGHWEKGLGMLAPADDRLPVSRERAAALTARIPRLELELAAPAPPGIRVEIDGAAAELAELRAGKRLDPGEHTVALFAPGREVRRATVVLAEGESRTVTLSIPPAAAAPVEAPIAPEGGRGAVWKAGLVVGGVGVASMIVAGVTGGVLVTRNAAIQHDCPKRQCTQEGMDLIHGSGPLKAANAVAWGVGLAGLAGGVLMVTLGRGAKATRVAPTALPGGGGISATGRF
jgi:hypothetical protein